MYSAEHSLDPHGGPNIASRTLPLQPRARHMPGNAPSDPPGTGVGRRHVWSKASAGLNSRLSRIRAWAQRDTAVARVMTVLLVVLLLVCLFLLSACTYLVVYPRGALSEPGGTVSTNMQTDDDAMIYVWRLHQMAVRTDDEYHKKALSDYLSAYKRHIERRRAALAGGARPIEQFEPTDPFVASSPPGVERSEEAASLQKVLSALGALLSVIESRMPSDGLQRAAAAINEEFSNPRTDASVHSFFSRLHGTGSVPSEKEVGYASDDIEVLQLREFVRQHRGAAPGVVAAAKDRLRRLESTTSSVHGGRFYYPLRRYSRGCPFATETGEATAAWHDALLSDHAERYGMAPVPFAKPAAEREYISAVKPRLSGPLRAANEGTVFVSIASYRDAECWPTVEHMRHRAANPFRVFLGIAEQRNENEFPCLRTELLEPQPCPTRHSVDGGVCFFVDNIRLRRIRPAVAAGPTYGRYMAMLLYAGEDYAMVIDSHSRFVYAWDTRLVQLYLEAKHPKMVLSHYPGSYKEKKDFVWEPPTTTYLCRAKFLDGFGYIRLSAASVGNISSYKKNAKFQKPFEIASLQLDPSVVRPLPQPWAAGGFLFANASIFREVPFDPHLPHIFDGEEVLYSVRLWTHGYDIHSPRESIAFHIYGRPKAPKIWSDSKAFSRVNMLSRRRVQYLLHSRVKGLDALLVPLNTKEAIVVVDIARYGMGRLRSVEDWYNFAGVDPVNYTLDGRWCGK